MKCQKPQQLGTQELASRTSWYFLSILKLINYRIVSSVVRNYITECYCYCFKIMPVSSQETLSPLRKSIGPGMQEALEPNRMVKLSHHLTLRTKPELTVSVCAADLTNRPLLCVHSTHEVKPESPSQQRSMTMAQDSPQARTQHLSSIQTSCWDSCGQDTSLHQEHHEARDLWQ